MTEVTPPDLKPCPLCGSDSLIVTLEPASETNDGAGNTTTCPDHWHVTCDARAGGCGCDGPWCQSANEATRSWNRRAELAQPAQAEPVHPNHRPDLRYVLNALQKVVPVLKKDASLRGEIEAAITGMRYIIKRTEESAAPVSQGARPMPRLEDSPFESLMAQLLYAAWIDGWASCRDAEFVGEEAMNEAFNGSDTLEVCLNADRQAPSAQVASQGAEPSPALSDWLKEAEHLMLRVTGAGYRVGRSAAELEHKPYDAALTAKATAATEQEEVARAALLAHLRAAADNQDSLWRLVALRVACNKFAATPPSDKWERWTPQEAVDWMMAQSVPAAADRTALDRKDELLRQAREALVQQRGSMWENANAPEFLGIIAAITEELPKGTT
jgi:hypothetical protein